MKIENKVFAKGLSFDKIFLFFVLGSVFGSFFEEIQWFFNKGVWTSRHDLLYGPFSTLYGFGLILFLIILGPRNYERGIFKTFLYSFIIGGVFEYLAGALAETIFGIKFWDYSNMILNINGRTTVPIMIVWGILGILVLKIIYPVISNWIEKIPNFIGKTFSIFLLIFLTFDMFLSYSVFGRMVLRHKGIAPKTFLGVYYDQKYTDEFMYQKYPLLKGE